MAGLILPTECGSLLEAIQQGDATVGWRGEPGWDAWVTNDGWAEVYGFDRAGVRQKMAEQHTSEPGWRHTLLVSLRDGDWRRDDQLERINARNEELRREREYDRKQRIGENAEFVAHLIRKEFGHHHGMPSGKEYL